ncbi:MAG: C40 family peptidase [Lachnospiraceae bacterium]|nr:C40 family peptidase [Lachnospiraceae bacterium]
MKKVAGLLAVCLSLGMMISAVPMMTKASDDETMYVCVRNITVHTDDNNNSSTKFIPYREKVTIVDGDYDYDEGHWLELKYKGKTCQMYNQEGERNFKYSMPSPSFSSNNKYQKKAMALAKKIYTNWDTGYGHNASNGKKSSNGKYYFDCSGFVSYVLTTPMTSYVPTYNLSKNIKTLYNTKSVYNKGYKGNCKVKTVCSSKLDESKLLPGDVLYFKTTSDGGSSLGIYNHCGIYIGNGEFIHASSSFGGGVRLMPTEGYEEWFVCAKRYLPTKVTPANKTKTVRSITQAYKKKNSGIVKTLRPGNKVKVLYTDNGNWCYVKLSNGKKAYVLSSKLR